MKFISWNVNGLRACVQKGFLDFFNSIDADFFCIQESKLQAGQIDLDLPGYHQYWNYAEKKGYSGTAIFAKNEPLSVSYGIGIDEHDKEGRVITLEYDNFPPAAPLARTLSTASSGEFSQKYRIVTLYPCSCAWVIVLLRLRVANVVSIAKSSPRLNK